MEVPVEVRARVWELAAEVGLCEYEDRAGRVVIDGLLVDAWRVRGSAAYEGHARLVQQICDMYIERFGLMEWIG